MATTNRHTAGLIPAVNDLVAGVAIIGVYIVRVGTVAEGVGAPLLLQIMTDFLLPLFAAVWLLAMPTFSLYRRIER